MKKLLTAYVMYFNKKYKRTGVLFQGRFKSEYINTDNYLKYLYAYIHLNPVKIKEPRWKELKNNNLKKLLFYVKEYPYSSLYEYINNKIRITNPKVFPNYFPEAKDHLDDLFEWLSIKEVTT